jgi:hypothetical protein
MDTVNDKFQVEKSIFALDWKLMLPTPAKNIVEKIHLSSGQLFLPILECVSNSIINLKLSGLPVKDRKIDIEIVRGEADPDSLFEDTKPVKDIIITDNGTGFDEKNYISFGMPHSNHLAEYGCVGLGRFTVLAAFKKMKIRSNFPSNGGWKYREFNFDIQNDVTPVIFQDSKDDERKTIVEMQEFFAEHLLKKTAITVESIAKEIMDHFLVFYLSNDLPQIIVKEQDDSEKRNVADLFNSVAKENEINFEVSGEKFRVYITRNPKTTNRRHHYYRYCADSRVIGRAKDLGDKDSIFNYPLIQDSKEYFLNVYIVSDFLDKYKVPTRNGWLIKQSPDRGLFEVAAETNEITFDDIERELIKKLRNEYSEHVKQAQEKSIIEWKEYIQDHPRFNSLAGDDEILRTLPARANEDKKEAILHDIVHKRQKKVEEAIQKFIKTQKVTEESIQEITADIKDKAILDKDSLADYMLRRRAVIELFDRFLEADKKGDYKLEKDIHKLIFPMSTTSEEINYDAHNLWLLDERLVSYQFIASDKEMRTYCDINSQKAADLVLFNNPIGFGDTSCGDISSLIIFEFKRPGDVASNMPKNNQWEFSECTDKYFEDFRFGKRKKIKNKGRAVNVSQTTPKFGYIVFSEIPEDLANYNTEMKGWKKTPFNSFYKIEPGSNMHIEVMTFDNLIKSAKQRHNPFFDRLFVRNTSNAA